MSEDDPTKELPNEATVPDTAPMLEQILAEAMATREMLMLQIALVRTDIQKLGFKMEGFNKRLTNIETDFAAMNDRVETLEGNSP